MLKIPQIEDNANKLYDTIRKLKDDVATISKNTNIPEEYIRQIKEHVFLQEHVLYNGIERFHTDLNTAEAWLRLVNNNFVQHDLTLLQHEFAESLIMNGKAIEYRSAHDAVDKIYNWTKEIE